MKPKLNRPKAKRPINVTVSVELLEPAKRFDVNLSQTLEEALDARVRDAEAKEWLHQNARALADYNARVERDGLWNDDTRGF